MFPPYPPLQGAEMTALLSLIALVAGFATGFFGILWLAFGGDKEPKKAKDK